MYAQHPYKKLFLVLCPSNHGDGKTEIPGAVWPDNHSERASSRVSLCMACICTHVCAHSHTNTRTQTHACTHTMHAHPTPPIWVVGVVLVLLWGGGGGRRNTSLMAQARINRKYHMCGCHDYCFYTLAYVFQFCWLKRFAN